MERGLFFIFIKVVSLRPQTKPICRKGEGLGSSPESAFAGATMARTHRRWAATEQGRVPMQEKSQALPPSGKSRLVHLSCHIDSTELNRANAAAFFLA